MKTMDFLENWNFLGDSEYDLKIHVFLAALESAVASQYKDPALICQLLYGHGFPFTGRGHRKPLAISGDSEVEPSSK